MAVCQDCGYSWKYKSTYVGAFLMSEEVKKDVGRAAFNRCEI